MELYPYQKDAVNDLLSGKHIVVATMGMGKTAMLMVWLRHKCLETGKKKVLIITTPSKRNSGDMLTEADMWNGKAWRASLSSFEVVSWHGLKKWKETHQRNLADYIYGFDEIAKASAGTSGMGKAFLNITHATSNWAGFTGTPGDNWLKFYPYFQATGLVRGKTDFLARFAQVATYKGYPEIVKYCHTDKLEEMWRSISTAPDTSVVEKQLPSETNKQIHFKKPKDYDKVIKTRYDLDGNFIDSTMGLCHYLRQICFTKDKQQWVEDFIENLGTNCVFFCNYVEEEERLCEIAKKALPKGAKIWRIDGSHHNIPTAETIGKYDIIVAHYASGGEALNLQFVNYWVSVSPNYSYSVSVQAKGRIRRIGQKKPMFYFYLRVDGTIEDAVYAALKSKSVFSEKVWCEQNNLAEGC